MIEFPDNLITLPPEDKPITGKQTLKFILIWAVCFSILLFLVPFIDGM
jgi:hypothetical protein